MLEEKSKYNKNLKLITVETVLTSIGVGFSLATINLFWNSIGMSQTDIGFTQMMFTIVLVCLDIPMGYIADKINRKVVNIIGDIGVALTFLFYAFAQNMLMAIISECFLGLFIAMTNGVDQSFIKYNTDMIDSSGNLFKRINTKLNTYRYVATFVVMLIGGFVAKYSLRLTIAMSFLPYSIGAILAIFIKDYAKKAETKDKNIIKDIFLTTKDIIKYKKTRTYILAYMVGKEITHPHIWVFTPLMIMVGVPIEIVSVGWILTEIFKIIGSKIAERIINVKYSIKFGLLVLVTFLWMMILIINTNIFTIWVFVINGLVMGIMTPNISNALQQSVIEEYQTSAISIASTGARLFYIPLVYVINYLGNIKLQLAFVGMIIIFIPISIIIYKKLKKCEQNLE